MITKDYSLNLCSALSFNANEEAFNTHSGMYMKNTPPQSSINATQGLLQVRPLTFLKEILYEMPIPFFVKLSSKEAGLIVL